MTDDKTANSLTEFIGLVDEKIKDSRSAVTVYRGHADKDYKMLPALFRESNEEIRANEAKLLREIEAEHPSEFLGMKTLDKLVTLQHYEFPTRLFDVTLNPLVALYFAADANYESDGSVIICGVTKESVHEFDSEIVVQMANLANLPAMHQEQLKEASAGTGKSNSRNIDTVNDKSDKGITVNLPKPDFLKTAISNNVVLRSLPINSVITAGGQNINNDDKALQQLASFVRADLPSYSSKPNPQDMTAPVYVKTKRTNPRIVAQHGAFILFGLGENLGNVTQASIIIPKDSKKNILHELDVFAGINRSRLFPELDNYLRYVRGKHCNNS